PRYMSALPASWPKPFGLRCDETVCDSALPDRGAGGDLGMERFVPGRDGDERRLARSSPDLRHAALAHCHRRLARSHRCADTLGKIGDHRGDGIVVDAGRWSERSRDELPEPPRAGPESAV